jgi:mannose-6-phosphate isomerase
MLKVLSINPEHGLSIQSHPDMQTAQTLHARDPEHYPDASHKPEIGVALTPVSLLYGFKPLNAIAAKVLQLPELRGLLGAECSRALEQYSSDHDAALLKQIFSSLLLAQSKDVARAVTSILTRFDSQADLPAEVGLMRRLVGCHGEGDVGLVALCIMNLVTVAPGQGVFIEPNTPHAYLDGDLVECMACSDNVIRAGLTPKFKDITTLVETSRYSAVGAPALITALRNDTGCALYQAPAREFSLGVVSREVGAASFDTRKVSGVALCVGRAAEILHKESGQRVALHDGGAVLLPRGSGLYELSCGEADLFVAQGGVQG